MRLLIHGSETAFHVQQFLPLMEILDDDEDSEYLFFHSTDDLPLHPKNPLMHRLRDLLWDRFGYSRNNFSHEDWYWIWKEKGSGPVRLDSPHESWNEPCAALKGSIPWKPDLVLGTTPHEGHMRYQAIPWARSLGIPILSIDHGAPMIPHYFGGYRGSMMGCSANAVWGKVAKKINVGYGAPAQGQVVTGSPTIDGIMGLGGQSEATSRKILLMTTHREPLKSALDKIAAEVCEKYLGREGFEVVVKPHPVELRNGTLMEFPEEVRVVSDQGQLNEVIGSAHCIISPTSSVLVPALALGIPFIDIMQPGSGLADEEELVALAEGVGRVTFSPDQMDDVIEGRVSSNLEECRGVFERLGHKSDGNNGKRVISLATHLASGLPPEEWRDPFA